MSSLEEKNIHGNQVEPNGQSDDLRCAYYIRSFENRRQHLLSDGTNHFVVSGFEKLPPFAFSPLLVRPGHVKSQVSLGPGPTTICLTSVDSLITEREKVNSRLKDFPKLKGTLIPSPKDPSRVVFQSSPNYPFPQTESHGFRSRDFCAMVGDGVNSRFFLKSPSPGHASLFLNPVDTERVDNGRETDPTIPHDECIPDAAVEDILAELNCDLLLGADESNSSTTPSLSPNFFLTHTPFLRSFKHNDLSLNDWVVRKYESLVDSDPNNTRYKTKLEKAKNLNKQTNKRVLIFGPRLGSTLETLSLCKALRNYFLVSVLSYADGATPVDAEQNTRALLNAGLLSPQFDRKVHILDSAVRVGMVSGKSYNYDAYNHTRQIVVREFLMDSRRGPSEFFTPEFQPICATRYKDSQRENYQEEEFDEDDFYVSCPKSCKKEILAYLKSRVTRLRQTLSSAPSYARFLVRFKKGERENARERCNVFIFPARLCNTLPENTALVSFAGKDIFSGGNAAANELICGLLGVPSAFILPVANRASVVVASCDFSQLVTKLKMQVEKLEALGRHGLFLGVTDHSLSNQRLLATTTREESRWDSPTLPDAKGSFMITLDPPNFKDTDIESSLSSSKLSIQSHEWGIFDTRGALVLILKENRAVGNENITINGKSVSFSVIEQLPKGLVILGKTAESTNKSSVESEISPPPRRRNGKIPALKSLWDTLEVDNFFSDSNNDNNDNNNNNNNNKNNKTNNTNNNNNDINKPNNEPSVNKIFKKSDNQGQTQNNLEGTNSNDDDDNENVSEDGGDVNSDDNSRSDGDESDVYDISTRNGSVNQSDENDNRALSPGKRIKLQP